MKKFSSFFLIFSFLCIIQADAYWKDINEQSIRQQYVRTLTPEKYRVLNLNLVDLQYALEQSSQRDVSNAKGVLIQIPRPDGSFEKFVVYKTNVMAPELAAKYPDIKTYSGQGVEDKMATIHLDITPFGFHAMILSDKGQYFIDPYSRDNRQYYISYFKSDCQSANVMKCEFENDLEHTPIDQSIQHRNEGIQLPSPQYTNGTELRTYRLALACTGEYASYHGGTKPLVLAAMVTTMNRVNGVYEKEIAATMQLIANNDLIIYLSASSDPYTNNNGGTMLGQNQTTINNIIGSPNYDIGHVFSTGGGGIASLASVCKSNKAQGVTGLSAPIGDPFDIDYVAHEMGHQFGGNHTFNGNSGACSGNINTNTAYEPGSGSTIMAYAGICSPQNLQNNSNAYFHSASFFEMVNYSVLGTGNSCANQSNTNNNPPVAILSGTAYTIPISTTFILEGSGFDADGDPLTYCWEQIDLGPAGNPNSPSGNAPLFRSFTPVTVGHRYFPKIQSIVTNTTSVGEKLPSYARNMKFRLMVRDNRLGGGGVSYNDTLVNIAVHNSGAPFLVTAPNTNVSWIGNSIETVTWDVVGTDQAPVNTPLVDIFLSTDGGFTYPIVLATNTPNDGSENITVPNISATQARVMVRGAGNIFFDISNQNFSISPFVGIDENEFDQLVSISPNPISSNEFNIQFNSTKSGKVLVKLFDVKGELVEMFSWLKSANESTGTFRLKGLSAGSYFVQINFENQSTSKQLIRVK
ncbi:MAG TPA: M12 family metallo-peptidase [Bacteroidia bacterium]|nr:M12 family metallo-peptidase [Bacteroidia bacterium]HNT80672.1 M12 family metallo-peptidase [Bacteroidia bacterium]